MKRRERFSRTLRRLQFLLGFQRSLRLLVRAAWLGLGGVLCGWSMSKWLTWMEDPRRWLILGALLSALPILSILVTWPRVNKLVWSVDRKLAYKEQVSTAWSVIKTKRADPLALSLLEDARVLVLQTLKRMLWRGWFLERDLLSLAMVSVLALVIRGQILDTQVLPELATGARPARLHSLIQDPTIKEVFPDGIMGMFVGTDAIPTSIDVASGLDSSDQLSDQDYEMLTNALKNMGNMLSDSMSTYELSESLINSDLATSAAELEKLSDQLDRLPQETKNLLSEAMTKAAEELALSNLEEFKASLEQAASSLNSPSQSGDLKTKEQMDEVASEIRKLAQVLAQAANPGAFDTEQGGDLGADQSGEGGGLGEGAGSGMTSSQVANVSEFERLSEQGEVVVIELPKESYAGILVPGLPEEGSINTIKGTYSRKTGSNSRLGGMPIIPQYYPWYTRYVIEAYFQNER